MIKNRTVLVLGAGASKPYGYPLGGELRDVLIRLGGTGAAAMRLEALGFDGYARATFTDAFKKSSMLSIDAFIARRPAFELIAKAAIASTLCALEDAEFLFAPGLDNQDRWYQYLWDRLIEDVLDAGVLANNNLSVVTFNYDRSLDYFLFESAKNTFGLDDLAAAKSIASIEIVHVYGTLGAFPHAGGTLRATRHYRTDASSDQVRQAASSLQLIPADRTAKVGAFDRAQTLLNEADRVGILGFGFDPLNCERLDMAAVLASRRERPPATMCASTYGLTPTEAHYAAKRIAGELAQSLFKIEKFSLGTLRETGLLLN